MAIYERIVTVWIDHGVYVLVRTGFELIFGGRLVSADAGDLHLLLHRFGHVVQIVLAGERVEDLIGVDHLIVQEITI